VRDSQEATRISWSGSCLWAKTRMSDLPVAARAAVAVVAFAGCMTGTRPALAQGSQAYVSLGAGATDLSGGVDWLVVDTPVAVGGELGVGSLLMASLAVSYQPFARQVGREVHPFLRASLTGVSSSPYSAGCIGIGGGLAYWPRSRRVGLRLEAGKLFPSFKVAPTPPGEVFAPRLWNLRAGVAFGW